MACRSRAALCAALTPACFRAFVSRCALHSVIFVGVWVRLSNDSLALVRAPFSLLGHLNARFQLNSWFSLIQSSDLSDGVLSVTPQVNNYASNIGLEWRTA